jgi:hypothetical protein
MSKRRRYEGAVMSVSEAGVSPEPQAEPRANGEHSAAVDDRSAGRGVDSVQYSYPIEVDGVGVVLPKDPF